MKALQKCTQVLNLYKNDMGTGGSFLEKITKIFPCIYYDDGVNCIITQKRPEEELIDCTTPTKKFKRQSS